MWRSGSYPSSSRRLLQAFFLPNLPVHTAAKLYGVWDDVQEAEEVLVVVAEALPEHQAANHIGNGAAQEEGGIKRSAYKGGNGLWRSTLKATPRALYDQPTLGGFNARHKMLALLLDPLFHPLSAHPKVSQGGQRETP